MATEARLRLDEVERKVCDIASELLGIRWEAHAAGPGPSRGPGCITRPGGISWGHLGSSWGWWRYSGSSFLIPAR